MQTIADKLGITKVSVSKAVNGQPGISRELREKILLACGEMGYELKKSRARAETYNFYILLHRRYFLEGEKFYTVILYHLNKLCSNDRHPTNFYIISDGEKLEPGFVQNMKNRSISGIFILGEIEGKFINEIKKYQIPMVSIDCDYVGQNIDQVLIDSYESIQTAMRYLIGLGHKDFGFSGNIRHSDNIFDRFMGYSKMLMKHELEQRGEWVIVECNYYNNYNSDFYLPEVLPTAFVCHCDKAAAVLIERLKKMGYRIPGDISVIGFDNTDICMDTEPTISSMNVKKDLLARSAYDLMLDRIENPDAPVRRIKINCELIVRQSTGAVPARKRASAI